VWTGSTYGVAWVDQRHGVNRQTYFARLDAEAALLGSQLRVVDTGESCYDTTAVWTGSEFGVAWLDYRAVPAEVYLARIDAAGVQIGADIRVTTHDSTKANPFVAWSGSAFALAWEDRRFSSTSTEVMLSLLDATGSPIAADVRLSENIGFSETACVAWAGSEFGVAWSEDAFSPGEIAFTLVSTARAQIDDEVQVTSGASDSYIPSLAWTGSEMAVTWSDNRDFYPDREIYFNRIIRCD
jgi:hypothetical protein